MIGHLFNAIFSVYNMVLYIPFFDNVTLGNLSLIFFTFVMFIKFFVTPLIGERFH